MKSFFSRDFYRINAATLATILLLASAVGALQYGNFVMQGFAAPANVATGNIDQCRNGGVTFTSGIPTSVDAKKCQGFASSVLDTSTSTGWVNGNAGPSNAHWREGDFVAYRALITGMPTNSDVKIRISFDNVNGGKHALDYLGFGNATETFSTTATVINGITFYKNDNDPCTGLASTDLTKLGSCNRTSPSDTNLIGSTTGNANTDPLPATDPLLDTTHCTDPAHPTKSFTGPGTFNTGHTPQTGKMMIYGTGASIVGITYPSINILSGSDSCTSTIEVTIRTTNSNGEALLFWGGHIASENDWGAGNSASAISGSPYHMRLQSDPANPSTFSVGNQDRSLKTSAVVFTPTIATVIKDSSGNPITTDTNSDGIPEITVGSGGTTVHDTATLTNAFSSAGGQVTYVLYKDIPTNPVTCDPAKKITRSGYSATVNVANALVPDGPNITFIGSDAGHIFAFAANYTGDSKDEPAKSACEPLDVRLPPVGTIVIIKNTDPRGIDQDFNFSCDFKDQFGADQCNAYPGTTQFTLNDKSSQLNDASRKIQFSVAPGTYHATEINLPAGWGLKNLVCSDSDSTTDLTTKTATIVVASSETVTCTFTDARAVVKITGFGYTNAPAKTVDDDLCVLDSPTTGVLHGCATYTLNLHNYGKNATTLNILLTIGGTAGETIVSTSAGTKDNTAHTVTINGVAINAESDATAITVVVRYDGTAGQTLTAGLTVTYSGVSASGSPASVSFTLN